MADKRFFGLHPVLPAESWFVFIVMCCRSILPDFDFGCVNGRLPRPCAANGNKFQMTMPGLARSWFYLRPPEICLLVSIFLLSRRAHRDRRTFCFFSVYSRRGVGPGHYWPLWAGGCGLCEKSNGPSHDHALLLFGLSKIGAIQSEHLN
jgi:hypothetical protein